MSYMCRVPAAASNEVSPHLGQPAARGNLVRGSVWQRSTHKQFEACLGIREHGGSTWKLLQKYYQELCFWKYAALWTLCAKGQKRFDSRCQEKIPIWKQQKRLPSSIDHQNYQICCQNKRSQMTSASKPFIVDLNRFLEHLFWPKWVAKMYVFR